MKHQTQPTHDSCVVTCCAMLAGKPAKMAYEHFHEKLWANEVNVEWILEALDVQFQRGFYEGHTVYGGFVYLVSVPSLNCRGEFHQVILDSRGEELVVLDPARGLDGKFHYVWQPEKGEDPLAVPLTSWLINYRVLPNEQCVLD